MQEMQRPFVPRFGPRTPHHRPDVRAASSSAPVTSSSIRVRETAQAVAVVIVTFGTAMRAAYPLYKTHFTVQTLERDMDEVKKNLRKVMKKFNIEE